MDFKFEERFEKITDEYFYQNINDIKQCTQMQFYTLQGMTYNMDLSWDTNYKRVILEYSTNNIASEQRFVIAGEGIKEQPRLKEIFKKLGICRTSCIIKWLEEEDNDDENDDDDEHNRNIFAGLMKSKMSKMEAMQFMIYERDLSQHYALITHTIG